MQIARTAAELSQHLAGAERVAFVPTMGNLHEGHLALMNIARSHALVMAAGLWPIPRRPQATNGTLSSARLVKQEMAIGSTLGTRRTDFPILALRPTLR